MAQKYQVIARGDFGVSGAVDLTKEEAKVNSSKWLDRNDVNKVIIQPWKDLSETCTSCWHGKTKKEMYNEEICTDCYVEMQEDYNSNLK